MKKILISALLLGLASISFAQEENVAANPYDKYYTNLPIEIEHVQPVVFPETRVSLGKYLQGYGIKPGTKDLCTEAINQAIKDLSKAGGGHLDIPRGVWYTGPIVLRSNVDLHLKRGAVLRMTQDRTQFLDYDKEGNLAKRVKPGITAKRVQNIGITGEGTIDGQGQYWRPVKQKKLFKGNDSQEDHDSWDQLQTLGGVLVPDDKTYSVWYPFGIKDFEGNPIPDIVKGYKEQESMRNNLIDMTECENVLIEGVTITNSPKFHFVPRQMKNLIIDNVTIWCPWWAQNGDAMDIGNSKTVLIVNTKVNCGDDGICMKAGVGQKGFDLGPNQDFLIRYDTVYRAHGGFVIGSEFAGGMKKMVIKDCLFDGTDIGLRFKSAAGRGGVTEDIYCEDIIMRNLKEDAIFFESGYADKRASGMSSTATDKKDAFFPDWGNIVFRNITAANIRNFVNAKGAENPIHDMKFENVKVYGVKKEPLMLDKCENFIFEDCSYSGGSENVIKNSKKIVFNGKNLAK